MGKKILLLGAGGHAAVVSEVIYTLKDCMNNPIYEKIDYLDDKSEKAIGKIQELDDIGRNYDEVFCCIGNNKLRGELVEKAMKMGFTIPVLVHPTAYISPSAVIKLGTVVETKAIVNANSVVNEGCIISVGAIVDHDVKVGRFCHVNAGAICNAGSSISNERKIGVGEIVRGY